MRPSLWICQCMAVERSSSTCMRYMPTLRVPIFGSFVITAGSVMKGPASPGQQVCTGRRERSTSSPVSTTSCEAPRFTTLGRESAIDFSVFRPRTFSASPCGGCISSTLSSFSPMSSSRSTPKPRHMRRSVPNWLMSSGCLEPFGFSKSNAGPPDLTVRSTISVTSRYGSTSAPTRTSSLSDSSSRIHSRRSAGGAIGGESTDANPWRGAASQEVPMLTWRTAEALALGTSVVATAATAPALVSGPSPFAGWASAPSFEGAEVEPSLAADPKRAGRLVAVYQQDRYHGGGARGIVAAASTDGGVSWRRVALPVSACAGAAAPFASDPWVSVGPDGRIYAATLSDAVSVTTSASWGRTWSAPVRLQGQYGLTDKEAVTADPRNPGVAYVTWSDYVATSPPGTTSDEVVSVTRDGGRRWSAPQVVVRHGRQSGPEDGQIVADPRTGALYLFTAWIRGGYATPERPAWYLVSRSTDGGRHWSTARR